MTGRRTLINTITTSAEGVAELHEIRAAFSRGSALPAFLGEMTTGEEWEQLNEGALREVYDTLVPHIPTSADSLSNVETVAFDSETFCASSQTFEDGSSLIRVSDTVWGFTTHMAELLTVWFASRSKFRYRALHKTLQHLDSPSLAEDQSYLAITAALRFYIQHQRILGCAGMAAPSIPARKRIANKYLGLGTGALFFIVAHEMAHIALGHTRQSKQDRSLDDLHALEFDADAFAAVTLKDAYKSSDDAAILCATIALICIGINTEPLFVRPPESHPPLARRVERIANYFPRARQATIDVGCGVLIKAAGRAADMKDVLSARYWKALSSHKSFHMDRAIRVKMATFGIIETVGMNSMAVLRRFTEGLPGTGVALDSIDLAVLLSCIDAMEREDTPAALRALGISAKLSATNSPLSYSTLLEAITNSPAFGAQPDREPDSRNLDVILMTAAAIAIALTTLLERQSA